MTKSIRYRLAVQQRALPSYRVPFFDALAAECEKGLSIFFANPRKDEGMDIGALPKTAKFYRGKNIHFFGGFFYFCWQTGLVHWLQEWQPDVLIMEANPRYLHSRAAIRFMKARGGKVIGWGLGSPKSAGSPFSLRMAMRRGFVSHFDALITYSRNGAEEYATLGFPPERIFLAPNAVAPRPRHPLPMRPEAYSNRGPVVLFVGRLQARKRVDMLIRACASLPSDLRPELRIVGDGPQLAELKALAAQAYPRTIFYGAQHGADLERHFCAADLFVLPGTGGLAVQQAMSFGLPVIVGAADGTQADLVRQGNGWMLEDTSIEGLGKQLQQALSNVSRLRAMGAESYRIVNDEINLENMVAAFAHAVQAVMES